MRDLIHNVFVFAATLLLQVTTSCGSASRVQYVPVETIQHDTITINKTTTLIDTLIQIINSDSVSYKGTDTTSFLAITGALSEASYSEGELTHTLYSIPFLKRVYIPQVEVSTNKMHFIEKKVPVPVEVVTYKTPKWCWYLLGFNAVFALGCITFLILRLKL